jgi:hypothetical protein
MYGPFELDIILSRGRTVCLNACPVDLRECLSNSDSVETTPILKCGDPVYLGCWHTGRHSYITKAKESKGP